MAPSSLLPLLDALSTADTQHEPALVFSLLPEQMVWTSTPPLLNDPELQYQYGPTLLEAIGTAFPHLVDRSAVCDTLISVLETTEEGGNDRGRCQLPERQIHR